MSAKLSVVATPLGNLEDITFRAVRVLGEADIIACEDTRMTARVLDRYALDTKTISYHTHSGDSKTRFILDELIQGNHVALVSDAGTPAISDPGASLVREVINYNKLCNEDEQIVIESIPGPSAVTATLSIAGIERSQFTFLGFPPHKKGRQTFFKNVEERIKNDEVIVFYESVHRFMKTLEAFHNSTPDAIITVARELTKIHEQTIEDKPQELLEYFTQNLDKIKGEFVIIVRKV